MHANARLRPAVFVAGAAIVLAVLLAYANSVRGPFVYDDVPAIPENPTLATWWRVDRVLFPPPDSTVSGRPLLNATLALNYAIGGPAVWSYHLLNIAIHAGAALALFGLVRRTMAAGAPGCTWPGSSCAAAHGGRMAPRIPDPRPGVGLDEPTLIGFAVALAWALHPLVTEGVDYIVQRAESLMSLLLLLTLYAFVRAADAARGAVSAGGGPPGWGPGEPAQGRGADAVRRSSNRWLAFSVGCCAVGMAAKENMAAAPLIVLSYDRCFAAGSFAAALRTRRWYYLSLAATWLILGALILSTGGNRNGTIGFGTGVPVIAYWLTQAPALFRYLALSLWPVPLVFDYGTPWVKSLPEVLWPGLVVAAVIATAVWAWVKNRPAGFVAVSALAILAPTSMVPGTAQMIVEHRMYLPLAAVVVLGWTGVRAIVGRRMLVLVAGAAPALLALTAFRNTTYHSEARLWADTAAKRPDNARAYFTLAKDLQEHGRVAAAVPLYRKAITLYPEYVEAHTNLGNALGRLGRPAEAVVEYQTALRIEPGSAVTHNDLGNALCVLGRPAAAVAHYTRAIALKRRYRDAYINRGTALLEAGRAAEAIADFKHALALAPGRADAHAGLANALVHAGRGPEALPHFVAALRADPGNATVRAMYANALADANRLDDALAQFGYAVAAQPDSPVIQYNYGATLLAAGRTADAVKRFELVLRLQPGFEPARAALAQIRAAH